MHEFSYTAQEEQTIFIDLPDTEGLNVKGILRGSFSDPTAILVHGLPGSGNDTLPFMAARHLSEHGIASLRLFLYDYTPNARNQLDNTPDIYAEDLDTVVRDLRKRDVPKVFAVGHSFGGLTILQGQEQLDAAVLWEPTHGQVFQEYAYEDEMLTIGNFTIGLTGEGYVISEDTNAYISQLGDTSNLAAGKGYPLKIISAGDGVMTDLHHSYFAAASEPKEHVVIPGATHPLEDSDIVLSSLFNETTDWLRQYA